MQNDNFSTSSRALDDAIGVNGWPRGRICEVIDRGGDGATILLLRAVVEAQAVGLTVAWIDGSHTLDIARAAARGVDVDSLLVSQPDSVEETLDIVQRLADVGDITGLAIVVDLAPTTNPLHARLMSHHLRRATPIAHVKGVTILYRTVVPKNVVDPYGRPPVDGGGRALRFYSSLRLDVQPTGPRSARVKVVKNKFAAPHAAVDFLFSPDGAIIEEKLI